MTVFLLARTLAHESVLLVGRIFINKILSSLSSAEEHVLGSCVCLQRSELVKQCCCRLNQSGSQCLWNPLSSAASSFPPFCKAVFLFFGGGGWRGGNRLSHLRAAPSSDRLIFTSLAVIKCPPLCSLFLRPSFHPSSSTSALVLCLPSRLSSLAQPHNVGVCDAFSCFGTQNNEEHKFTAKASSFS